MAATYNDQAVLANDLLFVQRVRQSMISAAVNISSDGLSTGINIKRHAQVTSIMNNPDGWKSLFSGVISTQSAVFNLATATGTVVLTPMKTAADGTVTGNADTQQALVTDVAIDSAVSGTFNSFFGGQ